MQARNGAGGRRSLRHKTLTPERLAEITSILVADELSHLVFQDLAFGDGSEAPGVYGELVSFPNDPEICVTIAVQNQLLPAGAQALEPVARTLAQSVSAFYGCIEQEAGWLFTSVPPPTIYDPIEHRLLTRHPRRRAATPTYYWGNLVPRAWLAGPPADSQLPAGIVAVLEDWAANRVYVRFPQATHTPRRQRSALARSFFRFPSLSPVTRGAGPSGSDHDRG